MQATALLLATALLSVSFLPAQEDEKSLPRTIVELAVKAHGYELDSPERPSSWSEKGKLLIGGQEMPYTAKWVFQGPDKYRFDMAATMQDQELNLTAAIDGSAAWESAAGMTRAVEGKKLEYMKHEAYQIWLASLLPLLRDPGFKLSPALPSVEIDGRECLGVLVKRDKQRDATLYFDRKTRLLTRIATTTIDEFQEWKDVKEEATLGDYRDANGLQWFQRLRVVRDGKPLLESLLSDHKFLDKVDPKTFKRPE